VKTIVNRIAPSEGGVILATVAVWAIAAFLWPVMAMT